MNQPSPKIWVFFFIGMLTYGAYLYLSRGISTIPWDEVPDQAFGNTSLAIEKELTKHLSEQRHPLLTGLSTLKLNLLGGSITPKVEIGKEGWLFLKQEDPGRNTIEQSLGIQQYSASELKRWALLFQQRRHWTLERDMQYVLVFAPNKVSVYPEYLKNNYRAEAKTASIQQLKAQLDGIDLIDLADPLRKNKSQGRLFQYTDTHWNDFGAFLAYQHLIQALPEPFRDKPLSLADCQQIELEKQGGDLARLLLMDQSWKERNLQISVKDTSAIFHPDRSQSIGPNLTPLFFSNPNATSPKVLFDHDSFGKYLVPYLAEHFQESVFLWGWQGFHTGLIKREKPALVVDQFVERALVGTLPRNDWEIIQDYWEKHFNNLPDNEVLDTLSLSNIMPWAGKRNGPPNSLAIAKIHIQPTELDKLIVDYSDDRGYYWLPPEGRTYYLELHNSNIKNLEVEREKGLKAVVELRNY